MGTLLQEMDPDILTHFQAIDMSFMLLLPKAWLSIFARWLPLQSLLGVVPLLSDEGLSGVLAVSLVLLLYHRWFLLGCQCLEEGLRYFNSLPSKPAPEGFLDMC